MKVIIMEKNKKEKIKYANAYKEVLVILEKLTEEDYNKIPQEYIDFFATNCNNEYEFYYDSSKPFEEQELLEDTEYILFGLFEKFGASEAQKEKIKFFKNDYNNKLEQEKREKYNPDNILKNRQSINQRQNIEETSLVPIKEKNFILKLFEKIKNMFQKR